MVNYPDTIGLFKYAFVLTNSTQTMSSLIMCQRLSCGLLVYLAWEEASVIIFISLYFNTFSINLPVN